MTSPDSTVVFCQARSIMPMSWSANGTSNTPEPEPPVLSSSAPERLHHSVEGQDSVKGSARAVPGNQEDFRGKLAGAVPRDASCLKTADVLPGCSPGWLLIWIDALRSRGTCTRAGQWP